MAANLSGRVCIVTGGSRGIGRGIALQLGKSGASVYVTGRSKPDLESCCQEITNRGGQGIPVILDHTNDKDVENFFERVKKEQQGKLDLLVNNAYAAVNFIMENTGKKFWEMPAPESWDVVNNVGLRNHYLCSVYAARMMIPRKSGLIINISSGGGLRYLFNVSYGIGKAACDRMAQDCGHELRKHNVAYIALWPGAVKTEAITSHVLENADAPQSSKDIFAQGESLEFSGKAVAHLAADPNIMQKTGRVLFSADLAREYNFVDENGVINSDMRSVKSLLAHSGYKTLAAITPGFFRLPKSLLYYAGYKF